MKLGDKNIRIGKRLLRTGPLVLIIFSLFYVASCPVVIRVAKKYGNHGIPQGLYWCPQGGIWQIYEPLFSLVANHKNFSDLYFHWVSLCEVEGEFGASVTHWAINDAIENNKFPDTAID